MRNSILAVILLLGILPQVFSESADELAKDTITNYKMPPWHFPDSGKTDEEKRAYQAMVNSSTFLKKSMLDPQTSEKLRISYAIHLLTFSIANTFGEQRALKEKRSVLVKRFAELPD